MYRVSLQLTLADESSDGIIDGYEKIDKMYCPLAEEFEKSKEKRNQGKMMFVKEAKEACYNDITCKQFYVDGKFKKVYKCDEESMTLTSVTNSTLYVIGIQRIFGILITQNYCMNNFN